MLVLCWLFGCTLLMSAASSKLVTYIWPVFPALAILAAVVWVRLLDGVLSEPARRWFVRNFWSAGLCGPVALPIALLVAQRELDVRFSWIEWGVTLTAALAPWAALAWWRFGRPHGALVAGIGSVAVQFAAVMIVLAPHAAQVNTARDLARHFNALGRVPSRVVIVEDRVGSVIFYLDPHLRARLVPGQFEPLRASRLGELSEPPPDALIAVADWRLKRVRRYFDPENVRFEQSGRYRLYTPTELKTLQDTTLAGRDATVRR